MTTIRAAYDMLDVDDVPDVDGHVSIEGRFFDVIVLDRESAGRLIDVLQKAFGFSQATSSRLEDLLP